MYIKLKTKIKGGRKMDLVMLINNEHEDERALYNMSKGEVIFLGDYYHDKIDEKIEGFIECLIYLEVSFEFQDNPIWVEREDELFEKCNFY
jgi:hypothetical protein